EIAVDEDVALWCGDEIVREPLAADVIEVARDVERRKRLGPLRRVLGRWTAAKRHRRGKCRDDCQGQTTVAVWSHAVTSGAVSYFRRAGARAPASGRRSLSEHARETREARMPIHGAADPPRARRSGLSSPRSTWGADTMTAARAAAWPSLLPAP